MAKIKREKTEEERRQERGLVILSVITLLLGVVRLVLALKLTEDRYMERNIDI